MTHRTYRPTIMLLLALIACPCASLAQAPDTLAVFDAAAGTPGEIPAGWEHILPGGQHVYTTFNIERSIDGNYLRTRSAASASYLEYDLGEIDPTDYPILDWEWKVDQFPDTQWEQNESQDDFALRIELIYDFPGSWKNPLNIIRKGFFTAVFKRYPPVRIVSYVWSVNVPSLESYTSPSSKRMTIIPIESNNVIKSRWMRERINILEHITALEPGKDLVLKKIRIRADTDQTGSIVESGIKQVYLIGE